LVSITFSLQGHTWWSYEGEFDSQIRIIPMLHWHSILNKAFYFYQHIFTSVFQVYWSREDNGNSLSCREWKISSASLWPVGTTPEPQIKEHLLLQEVDGQQRDMRNKPN
jgi:hypothetical protein